MNVEEVRTIARNHGLKPAKLKKAELIRHIQTEEGNYSCYATAGDGACDQTECLWRTDCFHDWEKLHN